VSGSNSLSASISGSASLNVKVNVGGGLGQLAKAAQKSIQDIQDRGTVHVDGPGKRFLDERGILPHEWGNPELAFSWASWWKEKER